MQADAAQAEREKETEKQEERTERIEQEPDIEYGILQPGQHPLMELKEEDVEERAKKVRLPKSDQYFSPKGKVRQIRAILIGV
jgi:hypothetical protein